MHCAGGSNIVDTFPTTEDWDNEEWSGSLSDTKVNINTITLTHYCYHHTYNHTRLALNLLLKKYDKQHLVPLVDIFKD